MKRDTALSLIRIAFSLLGFSAVVTEIAVIMERGSFIPANFFSFFTIQANIIAVIFLLFYGAYMGKQQKKRANLSAQYIRGAVTLYMLMTGVIFSLLLSGLKDVNLTAVPWDNIVLHYIMPAVLVIDWLIDPPKVKLAFKKSLIWLSYPLVYVVYTLVRGHFAQWYPYPFLNASLHSYGYIFVIAAILFIAVIALTWALVTLPTMVRKR